MSESFLVIDDSKLLHQMYRLIFSQGDLAGSTIHYATNGREGYGLLAAHPDLTLVFLDLNMPEMNGLEVLARARAERLHSHVPIVLVTTESSEDDEARGLAVGAWDYLRKPFQPADIQRLVRRARELRRGRGAA
ncbi:MAG: response regulator [Gemmatimonadales bacterium]|nr:response regulator [Gemmatimonadales bacterium]